MQVLRNTYKSRQIAYDEDAYNLPLDTIYFIESKWNYRLNEYVFSHKQDIENILSRDIGGFFPYKFEIVSLSNLQNPLVQNALRELHPEIEDDIDFAIPVNPLVTDKEQVYQTAMLQRLMSKQAIFEQTLIARTIPMDYDDTYDFYAVDISMCSEMLVLELLEKYVHDLNYLNLALLGEQEFWKDFDIHNKVLQTNDTTPFGGNEISFCGTQHQTDGVPSDVKEEINKLEINAELKDLALKIKENIDSYQRTNGVNILLENMYSDFIKSFERLDIKPLSKLEIDNHYNIHLTEYKKDIKMHTLPKTVYVFFLRHPHGIYLKDISDYRQELLQIYKKLTRQSITIDEMRAKIDGVLDLTNGNLNQYICRISEAFRNELSTDLAKNYIISGKRNELRRITLDTDKVILPENLKF